ncbi:MAG: SdpI family protein [Nanoarchaeota archaeon]|nr:SdpI family protein [Nanoarchaeota archaeon]
MRKRQWLILALILISFAIAVYFYPWMPARMASHWNIHGDVDGYMPKALGLFLMPCISLVLFGLFLIIPRIDPLRENIKKFRDYFDMFIAVMILFLFYLYLLTILWNLGTRFNMGQMLMPAFGLLIYYCGILMQNAKRNWFIGIRTPWTISSEEVWEKTHLLGGRLFKIAGVLAFLGVFIPDYALYFVLVPVLGFSVFLFVYSYVKYRAIV